VTVPVLTGRGTPEQTWRDAGIPDRLPALEVADLVPPSRRVLVLAPHPDDEVLGCGGTLGALAALGCRVEVVAVTDGEASHPGRAAELREVRHLERAAALRALGLGDAAVHRLGLPDGGVHADAVTRLAAGLVGPDDLVLAPWDRDGHPDHDAVGAAVAGMGGHHRHYLVWAWHWAGPADLPVDRARRVALPDRTVRAKSEAVACFVSQLTGPDPILPSWVLARLLRQHEVLLP
jgi:LmbE family N-acetylglucosaminyl deacetylase